MKGQSRLTTADSDPAAIKRIHHVGLAVADLEQAYRFWRDALGLELMREAVLEEQDVRAALLRLGSSRIELLQPRSNSGAVARFLARGGGLHHICFETGDIEGAMARARKLELPLLDSSPRQGLAGRICFLHPSATHGVLIEYVEE
ncbi:MAG TPA: methylmalonyl-CoA epimerase [Candidatus Binataceae bacterium]|nr:methylmalonyl-CoA epimerase [Candidatus Binataceae bacterium]